MASFGLWLDLEDDDLDEEDDAIAAALAALAPSQEAGEREVDSRIVWQPDRLRPAMLAGGT